MPMAGDDQLGFTLKTGVPHRLKKWPFFLLITVIAILVRSVNFYADGSPRVIEIEEYLAQTPTVSSSTGSAIHQEQPVAEEGGFLKPTVSSSTTSAIPQEQLIAENGGSLDPSVSSSTASAIPQEQPIAENGGSIKPTVVSSTPSAIHQEQPAAQNGESLKLIIAKTVAAKDIAETLLDIQSFAERYSSSSSTKYQIEWRIFCYKNETFSALLERYSEDQWLQKYNTKIYLQVGAIKVNFWHKYLNPKTGIDQDVDYVWIMDGDIQIRHMAWDCFWDIARRFQPSIFAPSLMTNMDSQAWEDRKVYVGSIHPHRCHVDKKSNGTELIPRPVNNFQRMIAMDTWVVEIQLPVFSRIAWETTYNVFEEKVPGWGQFQTNWAPDLFWCKMIDKELHGTNDTVRDRFEGRPVMKWQKVKSQCDFTNPKVMHDITGVQDLRYYQDEISGGKMSHPCMIIHSTPVRDLDSRTIELHENRKASKVFMGKGEADLAKYRKAFPDMFADDKLKQYSLYRAYISTNETEYRCQACRHTACLG